MSFRAIGVFSHKEYAMAQHRSELMRQLLLIYPSFENKWKTDDTYTKRTLKQVLPEPMRIEKS